MQYIKTRCGLRANNPIKLFIGTGTCNQFNTFHRSVMKVPICRNDVVQHGPESQRNVSDGTEAVVNRRRGLFILSLCSETGM